MECVSLNAECVGPEGLEWRRASGLRMAQAGALEGLGPWDGSGLGRLRALVCLRLGRQRASGLGMAQAGALEGLRMAWAGMVEGLGPRDGSGWARAEQEPGTVWGSCWACIVGRGPRDGSGLGCWRASGLGMARAGMVEGLGMARAGVVEGLGMARAGQGQSGSRGLCGILAGLALLALGS